MKQMISEELMQELINYLDITWELTSNEEKKLYGIANRGASTLSGKIGECDFENDTPEKALLFNYVMYERSGALDEFWKNYQPDIIALQMDRWKKNAEDQEQEV